MSGRAWFVPEVVQTSAMDCGPACLKSLIDGYHGQISYGRLREACQTDVDGTSIDTLEDVANRLGVDAEQVLVPPEHVLRPELGYLPCIAVVRLPDGDPHFVLIWRRIGPYVQIMDPAFGRRWLRAQALEQDLYLHALELEVDVWRAWAASSACLEPLAKGLRKLGVDEALAEIGRACAEPQVHSLAALVAVARLIEELVAQRALTSKQAARLFLPLYKRTRELEQPEALVPERFWLASPGPRSPAQETTATTLVARGAVVVRVRGYDKKRINTAELPGDLVAALAEAPASPGRTLYSALGRSGQRLAWLGCVVIVTCALGACVEALLLRSLLDVGDSLRLVPQRLGWLCGLLCFLAALLSLELPLAALTLSLARRLELQLRQAFLAKLPRMEARYFRSRPTSDMAERAHAIYRLREVVGLSAQALRAGAELIALALGLLWLAPRQWPLVCALALSCLLPPLLLQRPLGERDNRLRTHAGALSRFYLDALLGHVPIATHGAARTMRRAHEALLVQWARAGHATVRAATRSSALHSLLVHAFGMALIWRELAGREESAAALLLVLWVMTLIGLAEPMAAIGRVFPSLRNTTLRLLEPMGAPEEEALGLAPCTASTPRVQGASVHCSKVSVHAAGQAVLHEIELELQPGERVAIVGASGAGKSSLCGLFLGWQRPASGSLRIDGRSVTGAALCELRRATAWVDAEVQLWNRSLADNVLYGCEGQSRDLGELCGAAELDQCLPRLGQGLQTELGEGGSLLSGGEGQRVRLARGLARLQARLVVLDEPFRGLDQEQRRRLLRRTFSRWQGATLCYVTHKIAEALEFDRVLVMHEGRIIEDGNPERLARLPTSALRALLAREHESQALWRDPRWRKLRLEQGRLQEEQECARAL